MEVLKERNHELKEDFHVSQQRRDDLIQQDKKLGVEIRVQQLQDETNDGMELMRTKCSLFAFFGNINNNLLRK